MTTLTINVPDFLTRTMDFSALEVGALIRLACYYRINGPIPDDERTIQRITCLDLDDLDMARVRFQRFFTIDSHWHSEELDAQAAKTERLKNRAKTASVAAHAKKDPIEEALHKADPDGSQFAPEELGRTAETFAAAPERSRAEIVNEMRQRRAPPPKPTTLAIEELAGSDDTIDVMAQRTMDPAGSDDTLGTEIPENFTAVVMTGEAVLRCRRESPDASSEEIAQIVDSFVRYHTAAGTISPDWNASWWRWWDRKKPPSPPKAKPRIEVSRRRAPPPGE